MDLKNVWNQGNGVDEDLTMLLNDSDRNKMRSHLPLHKLRKNLMIGILYSVAITMGYMVLLFLLDAWQVRIALAVLIFSNSFIIYDSWKLYKGTPETVTPSMSLKHELIANYNSFQNWWSLQERVSLLIYPIALTGGFMVGGILGSGKSVDTFLYNAKMLGVLGITILILVPVCYLAAKWMFNYAYGTHLKKIMASIDELD